MSVTSKYESKLMKNDPSRFKRLVENQFPVKEEMRKTSLNLPVSLDRLLSFWVNRENEKPRQVKVTREAVIADALRFYFDVK
jgi:hypothetical protein